jgi:gliding motility-associated-like protein
MQPFHIFVSLKYSKRRIMKKILSVFTFLGLVTAFNAQIQVTNALTPSQLVQNVLMGFGVTASNVTVNGSAANANIVQGNAAFFNSNNTTFPIPSGVLLTTGNAPAAVGPNLSGSFTNNNPQTPNVSSDVQLNAIANGTVTNGIVLEFDFVPAGDTIAFQYMFGSDEYPEFSPSTFNDAFGFFLWGPNPSGPAYNATNIALIPGTSTPVTINNVGPGAAQNPTFYTNNVNGAAYGTAIQYDGTTVILTAAASLICGETYHIKLAISNVGDQSYDSGVFLAANSFSSEAIEVAVATVSGDTSVYEGCSQANLMFIRPQTQLSDTLIINYNISGTATEGVDYNDLINPITFLPGEDTIVLTINPTADGISDNFEFVTITAITISQCGDTIISSGTLYILDSIPINITETDLTVPCADDSVLVSATATGLFPPFTYSWQGGQTGTSAYFPTIQGSLTGSVNYTVTATNSCGYSNTDTVTITLNQTLVVDTLLSFPATCDPIGAVSAVIAGATGVPLYNWTGPGPNSPNFINASVWENLSSGWYYFTVTDNVCQAADSVFVDILDPPQANFQANPQVGCSPLEVLLTNNSQNASVYNWDFGNGQTASVNNTDPQTQVYTETTVIRLIAIEGNCRDTAYASVVISICGCMDPLAVNYDPTANFDDGSCLYPAPTVYVPNVFTVNGDGVNDMFYLTTTNSTNVELTILNRWGNVVFEGSGTAPAWDGKTPNGNLAPDGTYFFKYRVEGLPSTSGELQFLEGHGFVQLVRN